MEFKKADMLFVRALLHILSLQPRIFSIQLLLYAPSLRIVIIRPCGRLHGIFLALHRSCNFAASGSAYPQNNNVARTLLSTASFLESVYKSYVIILAASPTTKPVFEIASGKCLVGLDFYDYAALAIMESS